MRIPKTRYSALILSSLAVTAPATAAPDFLPVTEVAAGLADGKPWAMNAADGKSGRVRFDKDGTGRLEGPVSLKIKWVITGDKFCMKMGFLLGTRCFQAVRTASGYQGYTQGKMSVAFSR